MNIKTKNLKKTRRRKSGKCNPITEFDPVKKKVVKHLDWRTVEIHGQSLKLKKEVDR